MVKRQIQDHKLADFLLCWGLTAHQPLWVILCRLPQKGRREIEETVKEMKERDRGESGTGMKKKKQKKKNIPPLSLPSTTLPKCKPTSVWMPELAELTQMNTKCCVLEQDTLSTLLSTGF